MLPRNYFWFSFISMGQLATNQLCMGLGECATCLLHFPPVEPSAKCHLSSPSFFSQEPPLQIFLLKTSGQWFLIPTVSAPRLCVDCGPYWVANHSPLSESIVAQDATCHEPPLCWGGRQPNWDAGFGSKAQCVLGSRGGTPRMVFYHPLFCCPTRLLPLPWGMWECWPLLQGTQ